MSQYKYKCDAWLWFSLTFIAVALCTRCRRVVYTSAGVMSSECRCAAGAAPAWLLQVATALTCVRGGLRIGPTHLHIMVTILAKE